MPTIQRHPIHIPYFVDRFRTEDPEILRQTLSQVMSELHRYLRYLGNTTDNSQTNFEIIDEEILDLQRPGISVPPIGPGQSPYPVQDDDYILLVDASSGPVTIVLPIPLLSQGRLLTIKKIDSSANFVTVSGQIDGDTDFDLEREDEVIEIACDGTEWWII